MIAELAMGRLGLLFDAVIAALLVATIVYAAILSRKLSALRDGRSEMEQLIDHFIRATERAEQALAEIRRAAGETGQTLQSAIEKGNTVADDLMFLVERAGALADRLERAGGGARETPVPDPRTGAPDVAETTGAPPQGGAAEAAFLKTLRGMR